jgi:hypothetical protein
MFPDIFQCDYNVCSHQSTIQSGHPFAVFPKQAGPRRHDLENETRMAASILLIHYDRELGTGGRHQQKL